MKRVKLPLTAIIVFLIFALMPVAETMAKSGTSEGYNSFRPALDVSFKCYDLKTNSYVWKLENRNDKEVDSVMWVMVWENKGELELANEIMPTFTPSETKYVSSPTGDLLEVYYDDGVFMTSVSKPFLVFWCCL